MIALGTSTVDIINPTWVDERGTDVPDYVNGRVTTVRRCSVQPVTSSEVSDGRQGVVTTLVARLPANTDITAYSRVVYDGITYDVDGEPQRWGGMLPHTKATLVERRG